jgi:LPS export ABC transporter permease LptF
MRLPRTVWRYVAREVLLYTLVGLAAVSAVFIGQNLLRRLADLLMIGVSSPDVLAILRCIVLVTLPYTVPISFLFGALVGVGRLASDVEIKALRACGIGLRDIVLPVFALGFLVSCLTWYLAIEVEHRAKLELREVVKSMTASGRMIKPRRFTRVRDRIFYVDSRDRDDRLRGVFIADHSNEERAMIIFAESGEFAFDLDTSTAWLRLHNGELHLDAGVSEGNGGDDGYRRMSFLTFEYEFEVPIGQIGNQWVRPRDMSNEELRTTIARARSGERTEYPGQAYEVQLHRRFALPMAPMLFALLAVPLSLGRGRDARSWGALLCVLLVAVYYVVLSTSQYMAMQGHLPSGLALWCPNLVFSVAALVLLVRARRVPR